MSLLKGLVPPVLLAVGIAAASSAGVYVLLGPHSGKTAAPVRNAVWTVDAAPDAPIANALAGVWETPDVVVRAALDGLHAVRRSDGTTAWDLPVPKLGGAVCALSAATDAGVGVYSYSGDPSGRPCGAYSGVDLRSGKVLWTTADADVQEVAVDGGLAFVRDAAGVSGLDLRTGTVKWKHAATATSCTSGPGLLVADHGRVATAQDCAADHVLVLDAKTGAPVSSAPGFSAVTEMGGISADPVIVGDGTDKTPALAFGSVRTQLADPLVGAFPSIGDQAQARADVALGGGVLCAGGQAARCFTAAGRPIVLRPLPGAAAERHDVIPVDSLSGDAARVLTVGNDRNPRASLCRVNTDGTYVVEAELSLAASNFLGKEGAAAAVFAVSDGKDLVLVAQHPDGDTALVDIRLAG